MPHLSANMASKHNGDIEHFREQGQNPRFGRCWWFWKPTMRQGKYPEHSDIDIFFLCFFITVWWSTCGRRPAAWRR